MPSQASRQYGPVPRPCRQATKHGVIRMLAALAKISFACGLAAAERSGQEPDRDSGPEERQRLELRVDMEELLKATR